jgi:DNA-binding XRE family transcriptional regulator
MAAMGIPQEDMGKIVGVEAKTLRKHCRKQLDTGSIKATLKVAQSLFKQATEESNTAAMIFWMKARAGWSEKTKTEITGADGSAVQHEHKVTRIEIVASSGNSKT